MTSLIVDSKQLMRCLDCEFADGKVIGVMSQYELQLTGRTLQQHIEIATGYYWKKLVLCVLAVLLVLVLANATFGYCHKMAFQSSVDCDTRVL